MSQLDQIRRYVLIDTPETVNANWASPSCSLDNRMGAFSLFLKYSDGVSVNMTVKIQLSDNNEDWADVDESAVTLSDDTGSVLYDIDGSGTQFIRVFITVTAGSIDVTELRFTGSQLH